jgi:hypothetical protein
MKRASIITVASGLALLTGLILAVQEVGSASLKVPLLTGYSAEARASERYGSYPTDFEKFEAAFQTLQGKVGGKEVSLVTIPNDYVSRLEWYIVSNYLTGQLIQSEPLSIHGLRIFNGLQMGTVKKISFAAHLESCQKPPIQPVELCLVQNGSLARCNRIELDQAYDKVCLETIE